ncbi:MAG TPA: aldose 1-epimerase [Burkholderiaceae bacterium]|nr:aldose 1-epimerase [Burkholderiaceae bacterium]
MDGERDIVWLEAARQRLGLLPRLGGSIAAWQWQAGTQTVDLWRPWDGRSDDRYTMASFAMLPWSNRISNGGFEHGGQLHPMRLNREGEPFPIHGDGWLQPWTLTRIDAAHAAMRLSSRHFDGNPYAYDAEQELHLVDGGLEQRLRVTHRGHEPLPYGLGLHPWFPRSTATRLHAKVDGVWLSGSNPLPTRHTTQIPASWDLREGASMCGELIDNAYTGWDAHARIDWPDRGLALSVETLPLDTPAGPLPAAYCLVYRPVAGPAFCLEPITHPIDAFHLQGRPGLVTLAAGQSLGLSVRWRVRHPA